MQNATTYLEEPIGRNDIAGTNNPARVQRSPHGAFLDEAPRSNVGQYFNNNTIKSKYAESLGDIGRAIDNGLTVEDLIAEKQSNSNIATNELANNVGIVLALGILGVLIIALIHGLKRKD